MNPPDPRDDTSDQVYTLETVEQITHVHRDQILIYRQHGFISPVSSSPEEERFNDDAIHKLRQISLLLTEYEMNEKGLAVFLSLLDEVERLRAELRFHRR